jgi:prefoldin subunit 5
LNAMKSGIDKAWRMGLTGCLLALSMGCSTAYYNTMERFGIAKRDILVDRVKEARDDQDKAKEQFRTAVDQFASVVNFDGGDLERQYRKLDAEYQRCDSRAAAVRSRIASVEDVAGALFREWEAELKEYSNPDLRRSSERQLRTTQTEYERLIAAMKRAESKMDPVLAVLRDQVLFLKHNLNAKAIASLKGELIAVETDVGQLIREMEAAIAEADRFISSMSEG